MRAQHQALGGVALTAVHLHPERVLRVARGVRARDVEQVEVVVLVLQLRALGDIEAHAAEDLLHFADELVDEVQVAAVLRRQLQRHVQAVGGPKRPALGVGQGLAASVDDAGECLLPVVELLPQAHALLRGSGAQRLHGEREGAGLAAEYLLLQCVERGRVHGVVDARLEGGQ